MKEYSESCDYQEQIEEGISLLLNEVGDKCREWKFGSEYGLWLEKSVKRIGEDVKRKLTSLGWLYDAGINSWVHDLNKGTFRRKI